MKIIAGFGYDSRKPNYLNNLLGTKICGEHSLINELAFRAGTPEHQSNLAARVVHYMNALRKADDNRRFYSRSFQLDPIATSEELLYWRDWAIMHGWQPRNSESFPGRLRELNIVEEYFNNPEGSIGDLINLLIVKLSNVKVSVDTIHLHSPIKAWPPLYQNLFNQLKVSGVEVIEDVSPLQIRAEQDTDLWRLQQSISEGVHAPKAFKNDGTVKIYQCGNNELLANLVATFAKPENLVVLQSDFHSVEKGLAIGKSSGLGLGSFSSLRAPNSLIQLMFQCSKNTPSAAAVMQYLNLPTGKFRSLRRKIAKKFRDLPGYDRESWNEITDKFINEVHSEKPETDRNELSQSIQDWLPIAISDSDNSISIKKAIRIAILCKSYFQNMTRLCDEPEKQSVYSSAYAVSDSISSSLQSWPEEKIDYVQLNRLTAIALKLGTSSPKTIRHTHPADIIENPSNCALRKPSVDNLVWISPTLDTFISAPSFSEDEFKGINSDFSSHQPYVQQDALRRSLIPILSTEKSITIVLTEESSDLLNLTLDQVLHDYPKNKLEIEVVKNNLSGSKIVSEIQLPLASRTTDLGHAINSPREIESFSSLSSLAFKPHDYVLKYCAKLYEGSIGEIAVDARLKGNLAHRVIELWFHENPWSGQQINQTVLNEWLSKNLPVAIRTYALPLAQPGYKSERLKFESDLLDAMSALLQVLYAANVVSVKTEAFMSHKTEISLVEGYLDLLCELPENKIAIIDMKWGSFDRYRNELKVGHPLQLATYAHLVKGNLPGKIVDGAYFIISKAQLLCNNNHIFRHSTVVEPEEMYSMESCWLAFRETLQWRLEQLHNGHIEICYGTAPPDDDSIPPDNCLPLEKIEQQAKKVNSNGYKQTFKVIDPWRALTGNLVE